jgi:DNA-binding protein Fis
VLIVRALEASGGNQSQAARILRIGRDALRYKLKKHNL